MRENGRAPIGSLDHLYRKASSECITYRTDVLWKALWMHMLKRFRLHLEGRPSGLEYMKGRLCAVLNGASFVETLPNVTRVFNKDALCEKCTRKCGKSAFDHVEERLSK